MNWQTWKTKNAQLLQHIAGYEEMFVDKVLSQIPDITPSDVIPQYHFTDSTGNRYIDFMIINPTKGYCLPIELDGYAKMVGNGNEYHKFNDFLQRQNAIIAQFGLVLRYSNKTMMNNSQLIINEIKDTLRKQSQNKSTQQIKDSHTQQLINDYQQQINELNKSNHQSVQFNKLSNQINQLELQMERTTPTQAVQPIYIESQKKSSMLLPVIAIVGIASAIGTYMAFSKNKTVTPEPVVTKIKEVSKPPTIETNNIAVNDKKQQKSVDITSITKAESPPPIQNPLKPVEPVKEVPLDIAHSNYVVGNKQKVCGFVAEVKDFEGGTYLNIGNSYPNQEISIVVWKEHNLGNFLNSSVCTTGVIQQYKNSLQVNVNNIKGIYKN